MSASASPPASSSAAALPEPPWPEPPRPADLHAVGEARVVRGHAGGRYRVRTWTSDPAAYAAPVAPVGLVVCAEQHEADPGGGKGAAGKAAGPPGAGQAAGAGRASGASAASGAGASGAVQAAGAPGDEGPWLCLRRGAAGWSHGVQLPGQAGWARQGVLGDCAGCHDGFAR